MTHTPTDDWEAWKCYPNHRWAFNKLEIAIKLGYQAGPSGLPVDYPGEYIVRPIYNLSGMGIGTYRTSLEPDSNTNVPPGYFWCEYFQGSQYSIDYIWNDDELCPVFAAEGIRSKSFIEFSSWKRIDPPTIKLPTWISLLHGIPKINIEFIGDKIIEIHLRHGQDFPKGATEIYPVWQDQADTLHKLYQGLKYVEHFEDGDGNLSNPRLGFYYH